MFPRHVSVVCTLIIASFVPNMMVGGADGPVRSLELIDVALTSFDDTSAPSFVSAGDWDSDGFVDLLINGWRFYRNSGPPDYSFSKRTDVFLSTTSEARVGVWGDLNSDGFLDLFQGCNKGTNDRIWINSGPPGYELEDKSSTLFGTWSNMEITTGASLGDMDRDGDLDIYVETGEDWNDGNPVYYPDHLLRNDLPSGFTDVSVQSGIRPGNEMFYTRGSTWGDMNNDGSSDIYVSHYRIRENYLFVNNGDGTFREEGRLRNCSGLYDPDKYYDATAGSVYGQYWWGPTYGHTIGSSWMDLNRDGDLDIFTSDFVHKYVGYIGSYYDIRGYVCDDGKVYMNDGAPDFKFTDHRAGSGIPIWPIGGSGTYRGDQTFSGVTIGDYDSDGWEDIYIPQVYGDLPYTTPHLYRNKGWSQDGTRTDGTVFDDVTSDLGIEGSDTYANLFLDYDNDGDLDLLTGGGDTWDGSKWTNYRMRLYQNQGVGDNHWMEVKLKGLGKNLDAVGARVVLRFEENGKEQLLVREVRAGTGHAHQQSFVLHFGLGSVSSIEMMEVWWPNGMVQEIADPKVDSLQVLEQPSEEPPKFLSVVVSPPSPIEDSYVKLSVVATGGPLSYKWDTDSDNIWDFETTTGALDAVYHDSGIKIARCRLVGQNGTCRDVYPIRIDVKNSPPTINLEGRTVMMDDFLELGPGVLYDTPSDLRNLSWSVDWGDGHIYNGTGSVLLYNKYTAPGTYVLVLRASDGDEDVEASVPVSVENVPPWGYLMLNGGEGTFFDEDKTIRFVAMCSDTVSDKGDRSYNWDKGDGSGTSGWVSDHTAQYSYKRRGDYNVTVMVRDSYGGISLLWTEVHIINVAPRLVPAVDSIGTVIGVEDTSIVFDDLLVGTDTKTDKALLRYRWDFGDGNTTSLAASTDGKHTYTRSGRYRALCEVIDDNGATGTFPINVTIENIPPVIDLEDSAHDIWEDEIWTCEVIALDTFSDLSTLSIRYELGDGRVVEGGRSIEISYPVSGEYEASIIVMDDDGAKDYENFTLRVNNKPPTGMMVPLRTTAREDEPIRFTSTGVSDTSSDMPLLNISFDPGDGSPRIYSNELVHVYVRSGSYKVRMYLSDGDSVTVVEGTVEISDPRPVPVLTASKTRLNVSEVLYLSSKGSYDNPSDEPYLVFEWDLGDGTTLTGREVNHTYDEAGSFTVRLTVTDDNMMSETVEVEIEVGPIYDKEGDGQSPDLSILIMVLIIAIVTLLLVMVLVLLLFIARRKDEIGRQGPPPLVPVYYQMTQVQMSGAAVQPSFGQKGRVDGRQPGNNIRENL